MKVVFMGTPDFAVETLKAIYEAGHEVILVVSQPDKPKGRSGKLQPTPVKEFAVEHDIPVYQPVKIRTEESVEYLSHYEADLSIVELPQFSGLLSTEKRFQEIQQCLWDQVLMMEICFLNLR